jgi:hypothetical protein
MSTATVLHGDMLDVLATMPAAHVDSIVTDPPYGLAFMGKAWDHSVPGPDYWAACLRVLKPGGHLLAFGGTRTAHRLAVAIEDAGLEIRDTITWLYASGFPKSLDVSKAIDKAAGATREVIGQGTPFGAGSMRNRSRVELGYRPIEINPDGGTAVITAPATDAARQWSGWGTALKPASEPIVVARKPLGGTVAACVLEHGTGALNIDATRVQMSAADREFIHKTARPNSAGQAHEGQVMNRPAAPTVNVHAAGRWPANVVLTHTPDCDPGCVDGCPVRELDAQSGNRPSGAMRPTVRANRGGWAGPMPAQTRHVQEASEGGASRFFPTFRYCAKAATKERPKVDGVAHPTVKPLALMRWLVRLVTPPGGLVLDPFAGSGTTGEAAALEGLRAVLVERDEAYLPLIAARLGRVA